MKSGYKYQYLSDMKKLLLLLVFCGIATAVTAQHFAVFRFKAMGGITQEEVDAISADYIAHFHPEGYTYVEQPKLEKAIEDQGFRIPKMTRGQVVRVGQIVNATRISQGLVEVSSGMCVVEGRIMDVASGSIMVLESVSFPYGTSSLEPMKTLASKLTRALDSTERVIAREHYIDLGLPSGTLWKDKNESGFFDYDAAMKTYSCCLPTKAQLEELRVCCRWSWTGNGYKLVGPNGASIFLPAAGYRSCGGIVYDVGASGLYWSCDLNGSNCAWCLHFLSSFIHMNYDSSCGGVSVRLVKNKK